MYKRNQRIANREVHSTAKAPRSDVGVVFWRFITPSCDFSHLQTPSLFSARLLRQGEFHSQVRNFDPSQILLLPSSPRRFLSARGSCRVIPSTPLLIFQPILHVVRSDRMGSSAIAPE